MEKHTSFNEVPMEKPIYLPAFSSAVKDSKSEPKEMSLGYIRLGFVAGLLAILQLWAAPIVSAAVLFATTQILQGVQFNDSYIVLAVVSGLLYYIFLRGQMAEDWGTFTSGWTVVNRVAVAWLGVIVVLLLLGYATKVSAEFSRRALFIWFLATPPILVAVLFVLRHWFRRAIVASGQARSVVIVGVNQISRELAHSITTRPELGMVLDGFFDDRRPERLGDMESIKLLGNLSDLLDYTRRQRIDTIFVAIPLSYVQRTQILLAELQDTTASIYFVPDIFVFDLIQARTDDLDGIPVVALCETPFHGWRGLLKRTSDFLLALLILVVVSPAMLIIAIAIKVTSPGNVIFKQRRYGLDGEEIIVYKFRTMTVTEDGEDIRQAEKNDSRVTPFGRFLRRYSLDELPQLINVLQGRMSVVGPRPHAVAHNEEYRKLISGYMVRHKATPGITGLAQVNGCRGETADVVDMKRRIHYDLEYLRHWSLGLDLRILLRTLVLWFKDDKAY